MGTMKLINTIMSFYSKALSLSDIRGKVLELKGMDLVPSISESAEIGGQNAGISPDSSGGGHNWYEP